MIQKQQHHRRRLLAALVGALVATAALPGCGGSGRATAGPKVVPVAPSAAAGAGGPTGSSAGPWLTACDVLADADVAAAASGYGTTITVTGHQARETQNSPSDRISECDYAMAGTKGTASLTAGGTSLTIDEVGALYYFPLRNGYERVTGLGDEAAWTGQNPPKLIVRIGRRLYQFNGRAPIITDAVSDAQVTQMDRDVLLKMAKTAMAKV